MSVIMGAGINTIVNAVIYLDVNAANPSGNTLALLEGTDNLPI